MLSMAVGDIKQTIGAAESKTKPLSPLFELIRKHDLTGIKALASKEDPKKFWNQLDETRGITPLKQKPTIHSENLSALAYAARLGFLDIVKYLCHLDRWFSHIDESSIFNQYVLGAAFEEALIFGHLGIVKYLGRFEKQRNISSRNWEPSSLLEHVISPKHKTLATIENILKLIEYCSIEHLNQTEINRALLMVAGNKIWLDWIRAQENQVVAKEKTDKIRIALTKLLLDAKADPNCKNSNGINVLRLATQSDIVEMRDYLLQKGAKSEPFQEYVSIVIATHNLSPHTINLLKRYRFFDAPKPISAPASVPVPQQASAPVPQQIPVERKEEKSQQQSSASTLASVSASDVTKTSSLPNVASGPIEIELQDLRSVRPRGMS